MRQRWRSEEGVAVIAALAVVVVVLLLGAAVVSATVSNVDLSSQNRYDTQALEAADQAAQIGWDRINLVHLDSLNLGVTTPCLSWDLSGNVTAVAALVFGSSQWCPAVSVPVPGASSASYQLSQLTLGAREIIGTGTVNNVTRRVKLILNQQTNSTPLFGTYALEAHNPLDFQNGSTVINGGVRSDGSIKLEDTQVPCHVVNGPITPGPGQTVSVTNNASTCGDSTTPATSNISWQTITAPVTTNNSTITSTCTPTCPFGISWNSLTLSLTIQNNATLTLTGNTYEFCNVNDQNGQIKVAPSNGKPVQIYMLPPTNATCILAGLTNGATDLNLQNNNSYIINNTTGLGAAGVQIYVLGNSAININNSKSFPMTATIYGPSASLSFINQAYLTGAIAVNSITLTASATLTYDTTASTVSYGTGSIFYSGKEYTECSPSAGSGNPPDTGCP